MKTESKKHRDVSAEEVMKAMGPELMEFLAETLHTAVHDDEVRPAVDKSTKPHTS